MEPTVLRLEEPSGLEAVEQTTKTPSHLSSGFERICSPAASSPGMMSRVVIGGVDTHKELHVAAVIGLIGDSGG